jgi:hypothetical protein
VRSVGTWRLSGSDALQVARAPSHGPRRGRKRGGNVRLANRFQPAPTT